MLHRGLRISYGVTQHVIPFEKSHSPCETFNGKSSTGGVWVSDGLAHYTRTIDYDMLFHLHINNKGFHVTSYQANFASYHTRDHHVGFLSALPGIGKHNKMSLNFSFSSNHNTELQLSDKNINTHSVEILNPALK